jgi:MYXO-CTERM domain-containing protein
MDLLRRHFARIALPLTLAVTSIAAPTIASACSWAGGVHGTYPVEGTTHPANAPILLFGAVALVELSVAVDGAPASLGELDLIPDIIVYEPGIRVLTVDPQPSPGQTVVLTYPNSDPDACGGEMTCELSYIAGEVDEEPPEWGVEDLSFDLIDLGGSLYWECGEPLDGAWWWVTDYAPAHEGFLELSLVRADAPEDVLRTELYPRGLDEAVGLALFDPWIGVESDPLAPADPAADLCLRARWLDLALNPGEEVAEVCPPCRYAPKGTDPEYVVDEEDDFHLADKHLYPGGYCFGDSGVGTTGGETTGGETTGDGSTTGDGATTGDGSTGSDGSTTGVDATTGEPTTGGDKTTDGEATTAGENPGDDGCACSTSSRGGGWGLASLVGLGLGLVRRRRRRR